MSLRDTMVPSVFVVLILAIAFAALASLFAIISASTDHWEHIDWDMEALRSHDTVKLVNSTFEEANGYYEVVTEVGDSGNISTSYLRSTYGGIWRICDKVSDDFRSGDIYQSAQNGDAPWLRYSCFSYITQYVARKSDGLLSDLAVSLVRMQNSAASCTIVCLMCLVTAAVIGCVGVWQRQVSVCMVTGVMYIVAGVFLLFALVIMMVKVSYVKDNDECHCIDQVADTSLCPHRTAQYGYSVPLAWVAVFFFIMSFVCWLLLSRFIRLEKAKSLI